MSGWKRGDKAICIKKGPWEFMRSPGAVPQAGLPVYGELVCVESAGINGPGELALHLVGFDFRDRAGKRTPFLASRFRKVHDAETGTEAVETVNQPTREGADREELEPAGSNSSAGSGL